MRLLTTATLFLAFIAGAQAEQALALTPAQQQMVDRLIDQALQDDTAWDIVESLTTEVGPRIGGSAAEARARDWGAAKLKRLGFKNVRIETYQMPLWERVSEQAEIVSPFPQPLVVTAIGKSISTPEGGLTGEVVRFATLPDLIAAPITGLEGKIIFVDEPMARTQDGSGYSTAVKKRSEAAVEAGKRRAAAALIRSVGTDSHRNPHTGSGLSGAGEMAVPAAALSNPDADQLTRVLKRANGPVIVRLDLQVRTAPAVVSGNVIGEIPGKTNEIIVIGGHLDSWDLGTGAIDDGAGIAITTAAAKILREVAGKPTRTIRVVMWGAEEVGIYGGKDYAARHADELSRHILAAESDFGAGRVYQLSTRFGDEAAAKAVPMANALRRLAISAGANPAKGGADVSTIRDLGVPVLDLKQDGTDYFDLHHTPDDTLDKIDPAALRQNVAAWAAMLYMASEMDGDFGRLPLKVVENAKMNKDEFWEIIENVVNSDDKKTALKARLSKLPNDEIVSFEDNFQSMFDAAHQWALWGAAYIIGGGCSDDGFIDFRYGLISMGRDIYENAISNPDSLASLGADVVIDDELFGYVAQKIYEERTGDPMPRKVSPYKPPAGDEWDFDEEKENRKRLPELMKVHW